MKKLLTLSLIIFSFQLIAQDTIVHKSGKIEAVKIIQLDENLDFIVYKSGNDTIYSKVSNFENYKLHSVIKDLSESPKMLKIDGSKNQIFEGLAKRFPRYQYGRFCIATNVVSPLRMNGRNSRITIEPEYRLNNYFSIKTAITLGLNNFDNTYDNQNESYNVSDWYRTDGEYNIEYDGSIPTIQDNYFLGIRYEENANYSVGLHPKFYIYQKHKKPLSLYFSAGIDLGIATYYQTDRYHTLDTLGSVSQYWDGTSYVSEWRTYWNMNQKKSTRTAYTSLFYRYEVAFGMDFNFSKSVAIGLDLAYSSEATPFKRQNDRVYGSLHGGDYELIYDRIPTLWRLDAIEKLRSRVYLIFRFGGYLPIKNDT